jgi:ABC-2 type transport system ATP-binding protein
MLEVTALRKTFGHEVVLDGLDLAVGPGEAVALLGTNGSGKTTTLRCIAGLTIPDSGRIDICGRDAVADGPRARQRLSYMPQRSVFPRMLSVRESLAVVARLRHLLPSRVNEEIRACALEACADKRVGTLSGGQRQRLALAIAMLPNADLYLFDEPSANLDAASLELFRGRASALAREGHAVVFTTHSREDVEVLATRVVRLDHGCCASDDLVVSPSHTSLRLVGAR